MNIFNENIYIIPYLVILQKESQQIEYLFVGNLKPENKKMVSKLLENQGNIDKLTNKEMIELGSLYGKHFKDLQKSLKRKVEVIYQHVYPNDNVLTLKKKIFAFISQKSNVIPVENLYLYVKNKVDNRFFLELVENMYSRVSSLSKKEVKSELSKVLEKKIVLDKKIYTKDTLKHLLLDTFKDRSITNYDFPVSLNFRDKSNNLHICEFADPYSNTDEENLHNDKTDSNDYEVLSSFHCDHTIYAVNLIDYRKSTNYQKYVEERYWPNYKITDIDFDNEKKELVDLFHSIDTKNDRLLAINQHQLSNQVDTKKMGIYNEIMTNKIVNTSILYNPIINFDINLVKFFDLFKVDRTIPYLNFIGDRRKQSKIKIYEPAYYGDDVDINELILKQWRETQLSNEEKYYLTKKQYMVLKCKFKEQYLTFMVNKEGVIIINVSSISMHKKTLFDIELHELIETVNNKIISKINKTLGLEKAKNKLEVVKYKFIKFLQLSGTKEVKLLQHTNMSVLYNLINHYNEFTFIKSKQLEDDIEMGLKKKKNNYGLKKVSEFGSLSNIESFISQLILDSNNELSKGDIETKIKNSFQLSQSETVNIYSNLINGLNDAVRDQEDKEKTNILAVIRKNLKKVSDSITYQIYQVGDTLKINFAHVKNESELIQLNNFLDNLVKEFLINKSYKASKEEIKIQEQEKKLDEVLAKQIQVKSIDHFASEPKKKFLLDDSNSNNNNNDSDNNGSANNDSANNDSANNTKPKEEPVVTKDKEPSIEVDLDVDFEYSNLKEYFTEMRAKFDPELFISKRKTKDKLITDKREEAKIKYTTRCQSVNDKFPIIISKNKLKGIQENPKLLEGLDIFNYQELDKNGEVKRENASYFILGGYKNRNVYICPRIWCVKCEIPINPIDFTNKPVCPKCNGKILKDKKERITLEKTVYIRRHPNTWKDGKKKSYLNRFLNNVLHNITIDVELKDLVIKELKNSQKSMYPYYLKPQKIDKNIALTCCGSKSLPLTDEEEKPKVSKGETIYYFLNKKDVVEEGKMAFVVDNLNYILGNLEEKKTRKQFKYYFQFLGNVYIYNDFFKQRRKFFRLGVEPSSKNGFINCLNGAVHVVRKNLNPEEPKQNYVKKLLNDINVFKPSLFIQLVNGNAVELFRNKFTLGEYFTQEDDGSRMDNIKEFKEWIKIFKDDLGLVGITVDSSFNYNKLLVNDNINELWSIFSAFNYFKKYLLNPNSTKNMEFVWDFFSKPNILHPDGTNIIILDVDNNQKETKYSLLCPKYYAGKDFYNKNKPTLIILKYHKSYELVCQVHFKYSSAESESVEVLHPYNIIKNMENENLLNLVIQKCSRMTHDRNIVRLYQLEYVLSKLNLGPDYNIDRYIRGKYPKIIGITLNNKLYLPVYPESIKDYQLNLVSGIADLKKNSLLSLEEFLNFKKQLDKVNKFFSYLDVKHIFNDEEKEVGFVRLGGENLIPIKKYKDTKILSKYYTSEQVNEIVSGIHEKNDRQKLDEFSIDDLIFDKKIPDDERIDYINRYNNNHREFNNIVLGVNSFMVAPKNKEVSHSLLKIILNPVYPVSKKRREIQDIFQKEKIFSQLFIFTESNYFKKKVPIISCYNGENTSKCKKDDKDGIYKMNISKLNLVNQEKNEELFQHLIIEEMIRNVSYGRKLVSKKIEEYELQSLSSVEKKDQIIFGADSLERIFHKLYSKRKVKFLRDIDNVDTKQDFVDVDYESIKNEDKSIRNNIEDDDDHKIYLLASKKSKKKVKKVKKDKKKSSILLQQNNNQNMPEIMTTDTDMFGIKDTDSKVKAGKCQLPFNMTTRQKINGKNVSRPWHKYEDCILGREGPYCPTEVVKTKKAVQGKLKKLNEYQETSKHQSKRGYCNWEQFFKKELKGILLNKKKNPDCQENFKIYKDTADGKKELVSIKGCMPDQKDSIDIENPKYVCPNKKDVKEGEIFYKTKHQQEDCYV